MPLSAPQPDPICAAHRLLADANQARRHPEAAESKAPPVSSRQRVASASPSPPPVPTCSIRCRAPSGLSRHERRGRHPAHPPRSSYAFPINASQTPTSIDDARLDVRPRPAWKRLALHSGRNNGPTNEAAGLKEDRQRRMRRDLWLSHAIAPLCRPMVRQPCLLLQQQVIDAAACRTGKKWG